MALAAELEGMEADLILFGTVAAADDQQQVGPMVATLLERPCVTRIRIGNPNALFDDR